MSDQEPTIQDMLEAIFSGFPSDPMGYIGEAMEGALPFMSAEESGALAMDNLIAEMVEFFSRNREARIIMECARRAGIPMRMARAQWCNAEDVASEAAWDIWLSMERSERCPDCGTRNDEMRDPESKRPLVHSLWKLKGMSCFMCELRSRKMKERTDAEKESGYRYVVKPRNPLDPIVDEVEDDSKA